MKDLITTNTTGYYDRLIESPSNQDEAAAYLKVALEEYETDGDMAAFLLALRNLAKAKSKVI